MRKWIHKLYICYNVYASEKRINNQSVKIKHDIQYLWFRINVNWNYVRRKYVADQVFIAKL